MFACSEGCVPAQPSHVGAMWTILFSTTFWMLCVFIFISHLWTYIWKVWKVYKIYPLLYRSALIDMHYVVITASLVLEQSADGLCALDQWIWGLKATIHGIHLTFEKWHMEKIHKNKSIATRFIFIYLVIKPTVSVSVNGFIILCFCFCALYTFSIFYKKVIEPKVFASIIRFGRTFWRAVSWGMISPPREIPTQTMQTTFTHRWELWAVAVASQPANQRGSRGGGGQSPGRTRARERRQKQGLEYPGALRGVLI